MPDGKRDVKPRYEQGMERAALPGHRPAEPFPEHANEHLRDGPARLNRYEEGMAEVFGVIGRPELANRVGASPPSFNWYDQFDTDADRTRNAEKWEGGMADVYSGKKKPKRK